MVELIIKGGVIIMILKFEELRNDFKHSNKKKNELIEETFEIAEKLIEPEKIAYFFPKRAFTSRVFMDDSIEFTILGENRIIVIKNEIKNRALVEIRKIKDISKIHCEMAKKQGESTIVEFHFKQGNMIKLIDQESPSEIDKEFDDALSETLIGIIKYANDNM